VLCSLASGIATMPKLRLGPHAAAVQVLIHDERVTALHMTGSTATYNMIVWGNAGPAGGKRLVTKPFEAELGCITPYIVVPSRAQWTMAELDYQAMSACISTVANSGHNCNGTEVIITAKGWPQRELFLLAVHKHLSSCQQRYAWYPGSQVPR
jgi:acyl-CoA reductase-like NAD-dependent aldehyde dehydrogenase